MLELYQKEGCPFCGKVRSRLSELGLSWVAHSAELLERLGGSQRVPFLIDAERGVMMPESDDIIEYLDENYAAKAGA